MLTAYFKLSQDGIESLEKYDPLLKDKESGHYYFDYYRAVLRYYLNEKDRTSGVGILTFGPNGTIWCQTGEYCFEFNELASTYLGVNLILDEATKSQAKTVEIYLENEDLVKLLNKHQPHKDKPLQELHRGFQSKANKFTNVKFTHRTEFPTSVVERLEKESKEASIPPLFSINGYWNNAKGVSYFNIGMTEDQEKQFAEQYARMMYGFMESYFKEYETDYGKEAYLQLLKDIKENKVKELPLLKRNLAEKKETKVIKTPKPLKREIFCQNCETKMTLDSATKTLPDNEVNYVYKCKKCLATRILNGRGRTTEYGRFPKKKNAENMP